MRCAVLSQLADMTENSNFTEKWLQAKDEAELKELFLRNKLFINLIIDSESNTADLNGRKIMDLKLPGESLIAIIKREEKIIIPHGKTILQTGDRLSVIGQPDDILKLQKKYLSDN